MECCQVRFSNENGKEFVDHWEKHGWGGCVLFCSLCGGVGEAVSLSGSLRGRAAHYRNCTAKASDQGTTQASGMESTDNDGMQIEATNTVTSFRCEFCSKFESTSLSGLKVHEARVHGKEVNEARKNIQKKNIRWHDDDMTLLARCELDLIESGEVDYARINHQLETKLTAEGWTRGATSLDQRRESIRSLRKGASGRYKRVFENQREIRTIERLAARTTLVSTQSIPGSEGSGIQLPFMVPDESQASVGVQLPFMVPDEPQASELETDPNDNRDNTSSSSSIEDQIKDVIEEQMVEYERSHEDSSTTQILRDILNSGSLDSSLKLLMDLCAAGGEVEEVTEGRIGQPRTRKKRKPPNPESRRSRRAEKRMIFSALQKKFKRSPGKAVDDILRGNATTDIFPPIAEVEASYQETFNNASAAADEHAFVSKPTAVNDTLLKGFTSLEVATARKGIRYNSAVGPDKITVGQLKSIDVKILSIIFNFWLQKGKIPDALRENRTILIPKTKNGLDKVGNWRPITISSVILRLYSKMLAARFMKSLGLNTRQRGFMARNGCAENVFAFKTLLRRAKKQGVCILLLDLAKAFDTVDHSSIRRALKRHGVHPHMEATISDMYHSISTVIHVGGEKTSKIPINRGVKQGDPLSPILFNLVIDELIDSLGTDYGFKISSEITLTCLGYADDLVLFSGSTIGMKKLLDTCLSFFDDRGLRLNVKKCQGVNARWLGKEKKSVIDNEPVWSAYGSPIPMTDFGETAKYLGLDITTTGNSQVNTPLLKEMLLAIEHCKLRRTQKISVIRTHIIPKFVYGLGLSITTKGVLDEIDRVIRATIKRLLGMPDNLANEFFYVATKNGGLGLYEFSKKLPLLKLKLYTRLANSDDITREILRDEIWLKDVEVQRQAYRRLTGREYVSALTGKQLLEERNITSLSKKVQGFGHRAFLSDRIGNEWLKGLTPRWQGRRFIKALRLRSNLVTTNEMRWRGNRGTHELRLCRHGCKAVESQAHILQKCYKLKRARITRHHLIVEMVAQQALASGMTVEKELVVKMPDNTTLRPDLVVRRAGDLKVIDITVAYEFSEFSLSDAEVRKHVAYEKILDVLKRKYPETTTSSVQGFVLGARGAWSKENDPFCKEINGTVAWKRRLVRSVLDSSMSMMTKFGA